MLNEKITIIFYNIHTLWQQKRVLRTKTRKKVYIDNTSFDLLIKTFSNKGFPFTIRLPCLTANHCHILQNDQMLLHHHQHTVSSPSKALYFLSYSIMVLVHDVNSTLVPFSRSSYLG